jgi:hypothetical protein
VNELTERSTRGILKLWENEGVFMSRNRRKNETEKLLCGIDEEYDQALGHG